MASPKVYFATDHAGLELKNGLVAFVRDELGHEVIDCGAYESEPADDYPPLIVRAIRPLSTDARQNIPSKAIILGGSGQGEAMIANRFSFVRAAVYYGGPTEIISFSREHNDANVLSLGARFLSEDEAKTAVKQWLETPFSTEARHMRRIRQIEDLTPRT
ncbi:RpiB/LacA/LacB family sugar-phosphate isomerase [Candidatus Kaiserbacteria bacterium]|nr:RpiB/LacA/LacB family sugar-phosphate isomerase [Candidatus Kaiserbacteria bacterium]